MRRASLHAVCALGLLAITMAPAMAGAHTWDVYEVFSNADGTIQFVELREMNGGQFETGVPGHNLTSNTHSFLIPGGALAPPTTFKSLLLATSAFAALPGAPTPNYIIPDNFFSINGDSISYVPYDAFTFTPGELPTDGINSLNKDHTTGVNSPTNYAGQTGSVDASPNPSGVPDGNTGTPAGATKLNTAGSSISVTWNTALCAGASQNYAILFGEKAQLPTTPGGTFGLTGSTCGLTTSPYTWTPTPSPTGGTGLVWWLIVANTSSGKEGSWGKNSSLAERVGQGPGGSSGQCGVTSRNLTNTCGH